MRLTLVMAAAFAAATPLSGVAESQTTTLSFRFEDRMYLERPALRKCLPEKHFINEATVTESFGIGISGTEAEVEGPLIAGVSIDAENCIIVYVTHVLARQVYGEKRGLFGGRATVTIRYEMLR